MSVGPSQAQGWASGIAGGLQGIAAGMHNENQLMHELRMEQMAALRMQRYGGMYGGGGSTTVGELSKLGLLHGDPNDPTPAPWSVGSAGLGAQGRVAVGAGNNAASAQDTGTKTDQQRQSDWNRAVEAAHNAALANLAKNGLTLSDPEGQAAYAQEMNSFGAVNGLKPIQFTHTTVTPGKIFGSVWPNTDTQPNPDAYQQGWSRMPQSFEPQTTPSAEGMPGSQAPAAAKTPPPQATAGDASSGYTDSAGTFHPY